MLPSAYKRALIVPNRNHIGLEIRAFLRLEVNRFNTGITARDWRL